MCRGAVAREKNDGERTRNKKIEVRLTTGHHDDNNRRCKDSKTRYQAGPLPLCPQRKKIQKIQDLTNQALSGMGHPARHESQRDSSIQPGLRRSRYPGAWGRTRSSTLKELQRPAHVAYHPWSACVPLVGRAAFVTLWGHKAPGSP